MKRRKLLRSGKNTSAIGLGCMNFCGFYGPSDEKQAHNTLAAARDAGIATVLLGDALEGEARELGTVMAGIAKAIRTHGTPSKAPAILISGGETTVTIGTASPGKGGRNTEFLLGLALALSTCPDIHAIAADTDGIDGNEDATGAIIGPDCLAKARDRGLDPKDYLLSHDSYTFFHKLDSLLHTGPTLTNVNDFRAVLVI
ncbi:MOFRL family protein [Lentibacter algarum]|uniref:MOFRL family protein n=1 Tax=Lentibacter algarum TaxID=576131 RepID=UPI003BAED22E